MCVCVCVLHILFIIIIIIFINYKFLISSPNSSLICQCKAVQPMTAL